MAKPGYSSPIAVLTLTVFMGAFLLFSMEPYIGRILAPAFGGSVHVWLVCLTFFQLMLLIGYAYAYLLARNMGGCHLLLLLLPLAVLYFTGAGGTDPDGSIGALLIILATRFALPFAVLSTTAVVAQIWLSRSDCSSNPYPLYGASNAGSLAALIAYPFLIELLAGLKWQGAAWTFLYVIFAALAAVSYYFLKPDMSGKRGPQPVAPGRDDSGATDGNAVRQAVYWMCLSALTSALLGTVTSVIAVEMGSLPLIWIIPLAIYLLSFVMTFRDGSRIAERLSRLWPETVFLGLLLYLIPSTHYALHLGHLMVFAAICLLVHAAVYESRPHPRHLSSFYMAIAAGGFIGGMSVSLIAPLVFSRLWEYPLLLLGSGAVFFWQYGMPIFTEWRSLSATSKVYRLAPLAMLIVGALFMGLHSTLENVVDRNRNYYGITKVMDYPPPAGISGKVRLLVHGATIHGMEYTDPKWLGRPTLYYHPGGGLGDVFEAVPSPFAMAAVGMGAGTVAAYTKPGDVLHFYEIDGDLEGLSRKWFSFLTQGKAEIKFIVGDGRISLQRGIRDGMKYDLVFVDAFSGEGIPTHLLTAEAVSIYERRLKEGGVLLFHLTNRYYDLRPVVKAAAGHLGLHGAMKGTETARSESAESLRTQYVVLARSRADLAPYLERNWKPLGTGDGLPVYRLWTDDYVNILSPLAAKLW